MTLMDALEISEKTCNMYRSMCYGDASNAIKAVEVLLEHSPKNLEESGLLKRIRGIIKKGGFKATLIRWMF